MLADDERGGHIGQALGDVEIHRLRLAALEIEGGHFLHAATGAEGAEVEAIAEHAGAKAALLVAGIVLPIELAGEEIDAHHAAAGIGADDFLLPALQGVHDGRGEGVEAVRDVELPGLLASLGVKTDDAGGPLLLRRVLGIDFAIPLPVKLTAHDHDAVLDDGGDAGAVLMDVIGHMVVVPEELAGVVQGEGMDVRTAAPVDIHTLGIDEGATAGEGVVGLVDVVRDEFGLVSPDFLSIGGGESDDGTLVRGGLGSDENFVTEQHRR